VSRIARLSERYAHHHRRRGFDFVYGGAERSQRLCDAVGGPGRRVLDLGCRSGALTSAYAAGNDVVGLDVDRDALTIAAELGIDTVWADVEERLPLADESFDVVLAGELLEHLSDPRHTVVEVARVLRPGGSFVGSVPNAFRLKNRLRFLAGRSPERDPTHLHPFRSTRAARAARGLRGAALRLRRRALRPPAPQVLRQRDRLHGANARLTGSRAPRASAAT
jgi:SAM-dependent methyltransferase